MNPLYLFGREMTPLRKLLLMKLAAGGVPINEYTATGNPMSFDTNVAKPLKSLVIPWTPTQSGTGDPSPENVRPISGVSGVNVWQTGKNLFDSVTRYVYSGTTIYLGFNSSGYSIELSAGTYTFAIGYKSSKKYAVYARGKNASESIVLVETWGDISSPYVNTATFTINADGTYRFWVYAPTNVGGADNGNIAWFTLVSGETAMIPQSFPVVFPALGKNLLYTESINAQGNQFFIGGGANVYPFELKAGTYTLSHGGSNSYAYCSKKGETSAITVYNNSNHGTFTIDSDGEYRIWFYLPGASATDFYNIMLEKGNQATAYEPYTNTVYGGSLNLTTGVLTAEWWKYTTKWGVMDFGADIGSFTRKTTSIPRDMYKLKNGAGNSICNVTNTYLNSNTNESTHYYISSTGWTFYLILPTDTDAETPIEFAGVMNEPIIVATLTPQQVAALIGTNVLWSDTNGSNTAVYLKKG